MGTNRNAYVHQIGSHVIGVIDCSYVIMNGVCDDEDYTYRQYDHSSAEFPRVFWNEYGTEVVKVIGKMGASARGRILSCGVAQSGNGMVAYHEVNGELVDLRISGDELLTQMASRVVAAAIVDIFRQRVRTRLSRAEEQACAIEDARQKHLEQGVSSELEEWFIKNPLL